MQQHINRKFRIQDSAPDVEDVAAAVRRHQLDSEALKVLPGTFN